MPRYCKIFAGYVMPVFSGLLLLYAIYSEFSAKKAKTRPGWSSGITWLGRLLWFIPVMLVPLGAIPKLRIETACIYDIIERDYGIRFNRKTWRDSTFVRVDKEGNVIEGAAEPELAKQTTQHEDGKANAMD